MEKEAKIGFLAALATSVGVNIGGGAWTTPAVAAALTGPSAIASILIAGIIVLLAFPAYFTLSRVWAVSPGHYYYASRLLTKNKTANSIVGWLLAWSFFCIAGMLILPYMLYGAATFLSVIFPAVSTKLVTIILLTLSVSVVWFGLRAIGFIEIILVSALLITIGAFVFGAAPHIDTENFTPFIAEGGGNFFASIALVIVMMQGGFLVMDVSGEVKNGDKILDKVLLYGILGVILTSTLIMTAVVGTIPYEQLEGQSLAYVAEQYFSTPLIIFTALGAFLAGLTTNIAIITMINRYIMAAVDDKILPEWTGRENRYGEPKYLLVVTYTVGVGIILLDLPIGVVASGLVFPVLMTSVLVTLIGIRLPTQRQELFNHENLNASGITHPMVVRWSSLLSAMGMISVLTFLAYTNQLSFLMFLAVLVSGFIIYMIRYWQTNGELVIIRSKNDIDNSPQLD